MDNLSRLRLLVLFVVLMVTLAGAGAYANVRAQAAHNYYVPLIQTDGCPECAPRQTPTPTRLWQPWGYPIE